MSVETSSGMEAQYHAVEQFLAKEILEPEFQQLDFPPDLNTLRLLLEAAGPVGIVNFGKDNWHLVRNANSYPPSIYQMPPDAEVLIYSDPTRPQELTLPLAEEFALASRTAKNLHVTQGGITRYWCLENKGFETPSTRPVDVNNRLHRISRSTDPTDMAEYKSVLAGEGEHQMVSGKYITLPWEVITEPVVTAIIQM